MGTSYELQEAGYTSGSDLVREAPRLTLQQDEAAPRSLLVEALELLYPGRLSVGFDSPDRLSALPGSNAADRRAPQDASDPDQPIAARLMAASLCSQDQQASALADWVRRTHRYLSANETGTGAST